MSAGTVDPSWWAGTGIPILLDRYRAATAAQHLDDPR
jgi:hypothetical protein